MILNRKHIELYGKCLIEKIVIQAPLRHRVFFENEACFLYFKSGGAMLNASLQKVEILTGESVLLQCGNYFADFISKAPKGICEIYAIHLYPGVLKELFQDEIVAFASQRSQSKPIQKWVSSEIFSKYIEGIATYFEYNELASPTMLNIKLKELVMLILQSDQYIHMMQLFSDLFHPRKALLTEVINTHLFSKISVDELAGLSGMSLSTFKREFQLHFRDTPSNYFKRKRLEEAANLLRKSSETIGEIAFRVGFEDISHFSRSFRQQFGQTPSQYRITTTL